MHALIASLALWSAGPPASPVHWRFKADEQADGLVRVELLAETEPGWHIYATRQTGDEGPIPTSIRFAPSEAYALEGPCAEPEPVERHDPNFGMLVRYHEGSPAFVQLVRPTASGPIEIAGEVEYMVCNDRTCLPPVVVPFNLKTGTTR